MPSDVTREQADRQAQLWRALGPARQLEVAGRQWDDGRRAVRLALRQREPTASEARVEWLFRAHFVGEAHARRLYGPCPAA
ncbi:MAG: hypothetical protein U0228_21650 [Myxococcaceae bacterium]